MSTETKDITDLTTRFFEFKDNDLLGISKTTVVASKVDPTSPGFGGEWDYSIQINHQLDASNFMILCNAVCGLPSNHIEKDIEIAASRWKRSFEDSDVINNHARTDRNAWWTWQGFYSNYLHILQDRETYLTPTLMWSRRKTHARSEFSRRFIPKPGEVHPEHYAYRNLDINRNDALLGLITLLYLRPQLLEIPEHMGIVDSNKRRRIGPTELPLYVIMNTEKLMNSVAILALEEKFEES